jgi:hypothetical protein
MILDRRTSGLKLHQARDVRSNKFPSSRLLSLLAQYCRALAVLASCLVVMLPAGPVAAAEMLPPLSSQLPFGVADPDRLPEIDPRQRLFDILSWQTFVAANWPRAAGGGADPGRRIGAGGDHPTVWEGWLEDFDILVPAGDQPRPWADGPRPPPAACQALSGEGLIRAAHVTKAPGIAAAFIEPDGSGPLVDQDGQFVRYQISVNQAMYEYIRVNRLNSAEGLTGATSIAFPASSLASRIVGAISLKAAWKVLGPGDDPARFHTARVFTYEPDDPDDCRIETVALVGLHFAHKTEGAPQWIWSTFEHVDNAPLQGASLGPHYSFFDPGCGAAGCPVNDPAPPPWDPDQPGKPTQVVRVVPVADGTRELNAAYHDLLRGVDPKSVWANYQLIGSQRPRWPEASDNPTGYPWPEFLANTTMETFIQGTVPITASSCTECHSRATAFTGAFTDYTYLLSRVSNAAKN